jgi:hypothetical protein
MRSFNVSATANASLQNRINTSIISHYLRDNPDSYRALIARGLNLNAPAVSRAVEQLVGQGYVVETERTSTGKAKKAARLAVNTGIGMVIGIDLIKDRIAGAHGRRGAPKKLKATSLGIPAVLDSDSGEVTNASLYKNLEGVNLKSSLSALRRRTTGRAAMSPTLCSSKSATGSAPGSSSTTTSCAGPTAPRGEMSFSLPSLSSLGFRVENMGCLESSASLKGIKQSRMAQVSGGEQAAPRSPGVQKTTPARQAV